MKPCSSFGGLVSIPQNTTDSVTSETETTSFDIRTTEQASSNQALEDPTQPVEQHVGQTEVLHNEDSIELPISKRLRRARKPTSFFPN
ncbi:unnamed protein product [Clavelina lepadiformis]|uniref:Uncharacterized protein n=1 Tax=Clavelina lepadiformis TaxID=159417 RepID=A0ABP0FA45_CLALP